MMWARRSGTPGGGRGEFGDGFVQVNGLQNSRQFQTVITASISRHHEFHPWMQLLPVRALRFSLN